MRVGRAHPAAGSGRRSGADHSVQLAGVAHRHHLPRILGHLLEHERHLLVAQVAAPQILLRKAGQELGVAATEADAVVVAGNLGDLLVHGLVLLKDADQRLGRPDLVGGETILDEEQGIFLGGVHRATILVDFYKKSSTITH